MQAFFKSKKILVTGACGTIGRELVRQLLEDFSVSELIGVDNNESELFFLEQSFSKYSQSHFFLTDMRDKDKVERAARDMNVIFHTAAFKHVILCERSPFEAVQTNILGIQNLISAASHNGVENVIFTSSDKAVNPTNVMGTSNSWASDSSRPPTAMQEDRGRCSLPRGSAMFWARGGRSFPSFVSRYATEDSHADRPGNDRFIMSIQEAVRLVIDSAFL